MIPKFEAYHEDLHSVFISFERYKQFLQALSFSGYIKLEDSINRCFFFLRDGKDIGSFVVSENGCSECPVIGVPSVFNGSYQVSSFRVPRQVVDFFAKFCAAKIIYENVQFDSGDLDRFLSQIEQKKVTGFLEAARAGEQKKYVYFFGGKILGYMNLKNDNGIFEQKADKILLKRALDSSKIKVHLVSANASGKKMDEQTEDVVVNPGARSNFKMAESNNSSDLEHSDSIDRSIIIRCYEEILTMLENGSEEKDFASLWRSIAIELSNKYPFLNPFAGEFNYEKGSIDLWDRVAIDTAANALDELVNAIAKRTNIPKDGIKAIKDKY